MTARGEVPRGWPDGVRYVKRPSVADRGVPVAVQQRVLRAWRQAPIGAASRAVRVAPITDAAHPARGQHGLFAVRRLDAREFVIAYAGEVLPDGAAGRRGSGGPLR